MITYHIIYRKKYLRAYKVTELNERLIYHIIWKATEL